MRSIRLIPCLDVTEGRVVKGVRFVDLTDEGDPVELAARYDAEGADEVTFLDITASSDGRDTMVSVVERTAEQVFIPLTVGGGVRVAEDARRLLRAGADKVAVNTAAVERPDLVRDIADEFGGQCAVVAIDARAREQGGGWEVYTHGGRTPTGRDVVAWAAECADRGAGEILLTSMDRDGTKDGFDLALDAGRRRCGGDPGGGVGRRGPAAGPGGRRARRGCRRGARGIHLPPPRIHHRRGQGLHGRTRGHGPPDLSPLTWTAALVRYRARVPTSTAKNGTGKAKADAVDDKQPISVLFDRVMVQISPTDGERRSRAGILIPATAQITRRLTWAEAVAVGPHVRTVKVGDTVLFNPEDRFEVEVHGEEYVILRERDIHAIASPRNDSGTGLYL